MCFEYLLNLVCVLNNFQYGLQKHFLTTHYKLKQNNYLTTDNMKRIGIRNIELDTMHTRARLQQCKCQLHHFLAAEFATQIVYLPYASLSSCE